MNEIELMPGELMTDDSLPVKIKQISSPYGRCFEVLSKLPFRSTEYITILFNLTEFASKKVPIYIYEHGDIGLLGNYWVLLTFYLIIWIA